MLAIIGGSGLNQLDPLNVDHQESVATPYGSSALLCRGKMAGQSSDILFMPRHGDGHHLPPHRINYRANIWALKHQGATHVLAVNAVGGIRSDMKPGEIVIPHQIIDYTFDREHTFYTGDQAGVDHVDFTHPYDETFRHFIADVARRINLRAVADGVYGCSQGPRLETAAEVKKFKRDGCDLVGMTGMPEAALARELDLLYSAINLVVNWAAGMSELPITMAMIEEELKLGMASITGLITAVTNQFELEAKTE